MRSREKQGKPWLALVLGALLTLLGAAPAQAAIAPGDVLVADATFAGLYRVDPTTGAATPFAANTDPVNATSQLFASPTDVTVDPTGRILVADSAADGGPGAVIEVDPATGKQTLISANSQPVNVGSAFFEGPSGLEVHPSGVILVVDRNAFGFEGGVIAVDPATGQQSVFSSNDQPVNAGSQLFGDTRGGIAVLPSGVVLVGDSGSTANGLIAVDPADGKQSIFSNNAQPVNVGSAFYEIPVDPLVTPDGSLYVADQEAFGDGGIVGVDPATGKQSLVSSNDQPVNAASGFFADPFNLALGNDGRVVVADAGAFGGACPEGCGGLIAVDRATGRQEVLSSNAQPANAATLPYDTPLGVAVVPLGPSGPMAPVVPLRCEGRAATVTGTPGPDLIEGTAGPDVIVAQGGKDTVRGLGGADLICAGDGSDTANGGKGKDRLLGELGRDKLFGNSGRDRLLGGRGRDLLNGGKGADKLRGGPGKDKQLE
jgi:Ca2+-binding RTX toxin-like protein